ncbi:MAG: EamA family transporter, partial [Pseudomonadota bacterium]
MTAPDATANSILNRLALAEEAIGAGEFAMVRAISAAVLLTLLLAVRDRALPRPRLSLVGAASLCVYLVGFSFAYVSLDAGLGALVLFGVVQLVMFAGALLAKETVPPLRYAGAAIAFVG